MKLLLFLTTVFLFATLTACDTPEEQKSEEYSVVAPGKADNFLSDSAQEYYITGVNEITLKSSYADKTEEERLERVKRLIPVKQIAIGWFLNQYIQDKSEHDTNKDYGGFEALTKNGSYENLEIQKVEGEDNLHYTFRFRQEIGGTLDLLDKLPVTTDEQGNAHFKLIMGKVDNDTLFNLETNHAWYRSSKWSGFDPDKLSDDQKEELDLTIKPEKRSSDAWIDYNELFKDGVVTIGVHFGWDYHNNYHLKHSKSIYNWLVDSQGFKSPVDKYDDYLRTSGPLTKTIKANNKNVLVKLWLYWGKPGTDTDPDTYSGGVQLENDMREDLKTKEVIMFSGHSGPFYGFALANWRKTDEGDLDDSEIPDLEMPDDTYQVILAEGCETYALGQGFRNNPAKKDCKNIDIVTTTNFSNAGTDGTVRDFIRAIIGTKNNTNIHQPERYLELLRKLDGNSYWFSTMYGVHCIDDNPHLHPYADGSYFCSECKTDSDCGESGNICAKLSGSEKVCLPECTADDGCANGYKCMEISQGSWIKKKACAPETMTCKQIDTSEPQSSLIINEVLFDPPKGEEGDINGDGQRNASQDEFVELYNATGQELDISGYSLSDNVGTRFVFPQNTKVLPGRVVVVFGGGNVLNFNLEDGGFQVFAATQLGLNNDGDTVSLFDADQNLLDKVEYGPDAERGVSLVRKTDGDPNAPFVSHPDIPCSPGMKQDNTHF